MKIRSSRLTSSADDQECTLNIAGVCTYNNEETVLCHFNILGDKGMGTKSSDLCGAWGCSACHYHMDTNAMSKEQWLYYAYRGTMRTIHNLVGEEVIKIED